MKNLQLTDLDDLALHVRDQISRIHISEAISAYRGGAYRSSIVSTWIAVSYDVIAKIRELANKDDSMAIEFVNVLDNAIARNDIRKLQEYEQGLLERAYKDFEFLTAFEYEDLQRLKRDRNHCAHPAFVAENTLYQPVPELVRTHIVHAVMHLLQNQPVQGKSAIESVLNDIQRESFPQNVDDAYKFLYERYLNSAKDVLVRNLIVILLKTFLNSQDAESVEKNRRYLYALKAIMQGHPEVYEKQMSDKLQSVANSLGDAQLPLLFRLFGMDKLCWYRLGESTQIQLKNLLPQLLIQEPISTLIRYRVFTANLIPELKSVFLNAFSQIDEKKQRSIMIASPIPEFVDKAVEIYASVGSYAMAKKLGREILLPMSKQFSAEHVLKVLDSALQNSQIIPASGSHEIMVELFDETAHLFDKTRYGWVRLMREILDGRESDEVEEYYTYPELRKRLEMQGVSVEELKRPTLHQADAG